jgi:hypothetical protein
MVFEPIVLQLNDIFTWETEKIGTSKGQQAKGPPKKKVKVRINSLLVAIEAYWNNLWLIP